MALSNQPDRLLDYEGLAEFLGIGIESARAYNARATYHRKLAVKTGDPNHVRPGDLPEPDVYFGQSPAWRESTIAAWNAARPGRGNVTAPTPIISAKGVVVDSATSEQARASLTHYMKSRGREAATV